MTSLSNQISITKTVNEAIEPPAPDFEFIKTPELSDWRCFMFGSTTNNGMVWQPCKGEEPNWFWRYMQYLIFGNKWVKDK